MFKKTIPVLAIVLTAAGCGSNSALPKGQKQQVEPLLTGVIQESQRIADAVKAAKAVIEGKSAIDRGEANFDLADFVHPRGDY